MPQESSLKKGLDPNLGRFFRIKNHITKGPPLSDFVRTAAAKQGIFWILLPLRQIIPTLSPTEACETLEHDAVIRILSQIQGIMATRCARYNHV